MTRTRPRIRGLMRGRADDVAIRYVLDQGVARWHKPGFIPGRDEPGLLTRYGVPLRELGDMLGLLMVIAPQGTPTPEETDTIAQAVRAITAQLRADQLSSDTEELDVQRTLDFLFGAGEAARTAARRRIPDSGMPPDAPHAVVTVAQVSRSSEPPGQVEIALRAALDPFPRTRSASGLLSATADGAVLPQVSSKPLPTLELADQARAVREALATYLDASAAPVLGVGGTHDGLADAWTSRAQALVAARAARRLPTSRASAHGNRWANQIQEITRLDLDTGGDRLVLHLGLRALELLQAQAAESAV
ncbi:hypothetical protein AB0L10_22020 [Streptomyces flaveolus]|uniref:hypothetical protein n=1 Tax=Streptomyces flaveolus TaxID=67297 RepID=UPI003413A65B